MSERGLRQAVVGAELQTQDPVVRVALADCGDRRYLPQPAEEFQLVEPQEYQVEHEGEVVTKSFGRRANVSLRQWAHRETEVHG
jgi:hypothetical protein